MVHDIENWIVDVILSHFPRKISSKIIIDFYIERRIQESKIGLRVQINCISCLIVESETIH